MLPPKTRSSAIDISLLFKRRFRRQEAASLAYQRRASFASLADIGSVVFAGIAAQSQAQ
jgi:hypothetical protein